MSFNLNGSIPESDLPVKSPSGAARVRYVDGDGKSYSSAMPDVIAASALVQDAIDGIVADATSEIGVIVNGMGYLPPVAFASGINVDSSRFTVTYAGVTYAPVADAIPFTTTGTFNPAQWRVVQGVTAADLGAIGGAGAVGFAQPGAGAVLRTVQDKLRDVVTPEDFGAIGDGASHPLSGRFATLPQAKAHYPFATSLAQEIDYCAIMAAIMSRTYGTGSYISGPDIRLRDGATYYCGNDTIELKRSVRIAGWDSGLPRTSGPTIKFAENTPGIIVHRYNTIRDTTESTPTTAADGSVLQGFRLIGGGGTSAQAHGIQLRARAVVNNVFVQGFHGNGAHVVATSGGSGGIEGNANNFKINTARIENCGGHGLYVDGMDANSGTVIGLDAALNGKCGIFDSSFLGNTYIGCHTSGNGKRSQVHYEGNHYYCADDALGGSTIPGTNANVWALIGAGGPSATYPEWQSGGEYYIGAAYRSDNLNANNLFLGCYSEGGQPYSMLVTPTLVVGGTFGRLHDMGLAVSAPFIGGVQGNFRSLRGIESAQAGSSSTVISRIGGNPDNGDILYSTHSTAAPSGWRLKYNGNELDFNYSNLDGTRPFRITGPNTTVTFGRSEPQPYSLMAMRLFVGSGNNARNQGTGTAPPTTGAYARGDIVWNIGASAGGKVGWVCTISGSPGTWKAFGAIDP